MSQSSASQDCTSEKDACKAWIIHDSRLNGESVCRPIIKVYSTFIHKMPVPVNHSERSEFKLRLHTSCHASDKHETNTIKFNSDWVSHFFRLWKSWNIRDTKYGHPDAKLRNKMMVITTKIKVVNVVKVLEFKHATACIILDENEASNLKIH